MKRKLSAFLLIIMAVFSIISLLLALRGSNQNAAALPSVLIVINIILWILWARKR